MLPVNEQKKRIATRANNRLGVASYEVRRTDICPEFRPLMFRYWFLHSLQKWRLLLCDRRGISSCRQNATH
jgi:hypothetical protein